MSLEPLLLLLEPQRRQRHQQPKTQSGRILAFGEEPKTARESQHLGYMEHERTCQACQQRSICILSVGLAQHQRFTPSGFTDFCSDIHVASFFSIHRPISVTSFIPPASSESTFSAIFSPRERQKHQFSDVIYTVSSAIDNLEEVAQSHTQRQWGHGENDLHAAVAQSSTSGADFGHTKHLDGVPPQVININIEELAKQFRPFHPPPAPVPMAQSQKSRAASGKSLARRRQPTQKSYSAKLFITENTFPNGETTYETHASAIVEESSSKKPSSMSHPPAPEQPFLKHMLERRRRLQEWRDKGARKEVWRSISVKRQRKLKMKKHKYKKLMRRTRNLRRRLVNK